MSGSIRKAVTFVAAAAVATSGIALTASNGEGATENTTAGDLTNLELLEAPGPQGPEKKTPVDLVEPSEANVTTQQIQLVSSTQARQATVKASVAKKKYWYLKGGHWYWTSHKSKYDAHIRAGGTGTGTAYPFSAEGQRILKNKPKSTSKSAPKRTAPKTTSRSTPRTQVSGGGSYAAAASYAAAQVGDSYVWGGNGPNGWDCSGLVKGSYAKVGKSLPRTSQAMSSRAYQISKSSARPGDLVFWGSKGSAYHVGIYLGGGKYVHAANSRVGVVVYKTSYWAPGWYGRIS